MSIEQDEIVPGFEAESGPQVTTIDESCTRTGCEGCDVHGNCPVCGSADTQETPCGECCAECGLNIDEYNADDE